MIKRIITIAKKEVILIWRDKLSMIILIALPAVIIAILGGVLSFGLEDSKFYLLDYDNSTASKEFAQNLDISSEFDFAGYLSTESELESLLKNGEAKIAIILHKGFEKDILSNNSRVDVFVDASDLLFSLAVEQRIKQSLSKSTLLNYSYEFNPELKNEVRSVPGLIMIVLIIISSVMLSLSVNRERERGTSRLLILTPISIDGIIIGKSVPYIFIALLHSLSVLFVSKWIYGIELQGAGFNYFAMCMLFIINSICFGLLIAAWVKSEVELLIGCWLFLFIPNVFFSSFIYPIETMAEVTRSIASFLPSTLFLGSYKNVLFRNAQASSTYFNFLILFAQSVIIYLFAKVGFAKNFGRK